MLEDLDDVLLWDNGLSQFLGRLEEDLIRWHSDERVKSKERQIKTGRALQDLKSADAQVPAEGDGTWDERLEAMVHSATLQREDMRQMLELLRGYGKIKGFSQRLPPTSEGQLLTLHGDECVKHISTFLELVEKEVPKPVTETKRKKRDKKEGGRVRRPLRAQDASPESEWSSSRSRTHSRRRTRRRRYSPSVESSCSVDSRSATPERPEREERGRRGRGRGRGRGGGIPSDIDRFCRVNRLDARCEKILRDLSPDLAGRVMGLQGGSKNTFELSGDVRDPTAVVLARIRKAKDGTGIGRSRSRRGKGRPQQTGSNAIPLGKRVE